MWFEVGREELKVELKVELREEGKVGGTDQEGSERTQTEMSLHLLYSVELLYTHLVVSHIHSSSGSIA